MVHCATHPVHGAAWQAVTSRATHARPPPAAVEPPPQLEQLAIVERLHPALQPLLPHAMDMLALLQYAYGQTKDAPESAQVRQPCPVALSAVWVVQASAVQASPCPHPNNISSMSPVVRCTAMAQAALNSVGLRPGERGLMPGRHFSLRDMLKWCRRMASVSLPRRCDTAHGITPRAPAFHARLALAKVSNSSLSHAGACPPAGALSEVPPHLGVPERPGLHPAGSA